MEGHGNEQEGDRDYKCNGLGGTEAGWLQGSFSTGTEAETGGQGMRKGC